jgi:hypothetical protein
MKVYEEVEVFLALDGKVQNLESLGVFQERVSIKLNIPDVPSKLKLKPHGKNLAVRMPRTYVTR